MTRITETQATELFRTPPERFIEADHGSVAYRCVGTGPDVLFVHGWPVHSATFRRLLPYLSEHVTCHLIDLPGAGSSRYDDDTPVSIANHIHAVQRVVDALDLRSVAAVGHDSGGMIARHALAGDPRLRAMGLINTEQPQGLSWRFRAFLGPRSLPGFGAALGWVCGQRRLRRNPFILGDAFADRSLLEGDFEAFFLDPIHRDRKVRRATMRLLRSFDTRLVDELGAVHARIDVPVKLAWGDQDPFFPLPWAEEMVGTFARGSLEIIEGAGLFCHEERPEAVATALLPTLRTLSNTVEQP